MIAVEGLTKYYGDEPAVQDVTFSVERGEILGFLGPNGAGKTTTMRILTCYFPPTEGTATVAGYDVVRDSLEVRKRVGYMPESVPLYTDMPVRSYLGFVAEVKGVSGRDRKARIDEVMEECGLREEADTPIGQLSRGYRQRCGLAQAIVGRPDVLILDEPTVGLDPAQIREIRSLIKRIGEKSTVILSTHILPEVTLLCNRIVIISGGKVRAIDTPQNLTEQLQGAATIDVTVQGAEPARVIETLKAIKGVERVTHDGAKFLVEAAREPDVRPDIAAKVVQAEWKLLDLHLRDMSLEDIFVQITARDTTEEEWKAKEADEPSGKRKKSKKKSEEAS